MLFSLNDALNGKANTAHTHDDRYYTETEVNNLLANFDGGGFDWNATDTVYGTEYTAESFLDELFNIYHPGRLVIIDPILVPANDWEGVTSRDGNGNNKLSITAAPYYDANGRLVSSARGTLNDNASNGHYTIRYTKPIDLSFYSYIKVNGYCNLGGTITGIWIVIGKTLSEIYRNSGSSGVGGILLGTPNVSTDTDINIAGYTGEYYIAIMTQDPGWTTSTCTFSVSLLDFYP